MRLSLSEIARSVFVTVFVIVFASVFLTVVNELSPKMSSPIRFQQMTRMMMTMRRMMMMTRTNEETS